MVQFSAWPLQNQVEHNTPLAIVAIFPNGTVEDSKTGTKRDVSQPFYMTNAAANMYKDSELKMFDSSVAGVAVQKRINGFGQNGFSVYLVSKEDSEGLTWDQKVIAGDIVVIMMQRPIVDKSLQTVMVGMVKSVNRITELGGEPSNPSARRNIEIKGLDMTGWLMSHQIFSDTNFLSINNYFREAYLTDLKLAINIATVNPQLWLSELWNESSTFLSVKDIFIGLMKHYIKSDMDVSQGNAPSLGSGNLKDLIEIDPQSSSFFVEYKENVTKSSFSIFSLAYPNTRGSIGEFMLDILQRPFNEIIVRYSSDPKTGKTPKCTISVRPAAYTFYIDKLDSGLEPTKNFEGSVITNDLKPFFDGKKKMSYEYTQSNQTVINAGGQFWKINIHAIDDLDVITETLGVSSEESPNLFLCTSKNTDTSLGLMPALATKPQGDKNYMRRFGFNPSITQVDFVGVPVETAEAVIALSKIVLPPYVTDKTPLDFTDQSITFSNVISNVLKQWFVRSPDYRKGTITIKGRASINEGDALVYFSQELKSKYLFSIDSVTQTFINFDKFYTSLEVSRGVRI